MRFCEDYTKSQKIKCVLSSRNSLLFTFPAICNHHNERIDTKFTIHEIFFNVLSDKISLPLPVLHIAFSCSDPGCNDFTFLSDVEIIVTSISRGLSHISSRKYSDRELLMKTCCPDIPEFQKIRPLTSPPPATSWALTVEEGNASVIVKASPFIESCSAAAAGKIKTLEQQNRQLMGDVAALKVVAEEAEKEVEVKLSKSVSELTEVKVRFESLNKLYSISESKLKSGEEKIITMQKEIEALNCQLKSEGTAKTSGEQKLKGKSEQVSKLSARVKELEKELKEERRKMRSVARVDTSRLTAAAKVKPRKKKPRKEKDTPLETCDLTEDKTEEISNLNESLTNQLAQVKDEQSQLEWQLGMWKVFSCVFGVSTWAAATTLLFIGYLEYQRL